MQAPIRAYAHRAKSWLLREEHRRKAKALRNDMEKLFSEHPHETGETYWQHLWFTVTMSSRIVVCGVFILIHGIFPFLFTRTTSAQMDRIYLILKGRIPAAHRSEIEEE